MMLSDKNNKIYVTQEEIEGEETNSVYSSKVMDNKNAGLNNYLPSIPIPRLLLSEQMATESYLTATNHKAVSTFRSNNTKKNIS